VGAGANVNMKITTSSYKLFFNKKLNFNYFNTYIIKYRQRNNKMNTVNKINKSLIYITEPRLFWSKDGMLLCISKPTYNVSINPIQYIDSNNNSKSEVHEEFSKPPLIRSKPIYNISIGSKSEVHEEFSKPPLIRSKPIYNISIGSKSEVHEEFSKPQLVRSKSSRHIPIVKDELVMKNNVIHDPVLKKKNLYNIHETYVDSSSLESINSNGWFPWDFLEDNNSVSNC
jgi:hypothetical protein